MNVASMLASMITPVDSTLTAVFYTTKHMTAGFERRR